MGLKSSREGVTILLCLALLASSLSTATATYAYYSGYAAASYYYGYGAYPAVAPSAYSSPPPPPGPVSPVVPSPPPPAYYYAAAPTVPGYPVAPAYYYYIPIPPTPSPSPTPLPTPPPVYYAPPTPGGGYYYYTAPAPVAQAIPSPPGYPVAPTYYYATPPPTYYFFSPTPAPVSPTTPPTPPSPSPTPPAACPACPICTSPTAAAGRRLSQTTPAAAKPVAALPASLTTTPTVATHAMLPSTPRARPAGTCYCPYDLEWRSWPISLQTCRASLYTRCATDSRLKCKWLDEYFNPGSEKSFMKAHEKDISDYLYQDCPPSAPCACAALKFDKKDAPNDVFGCCRDLSIWAQVPHSGISAKEVDAFCKAGRSERVAQWVKHALWHNQCDTVTPVYHSLKSLHDGQAANAAAVAAASAAEAAPQATQATAPVPAADAWMSPAVVGVLVGVCAFFAVLGGLLGYHAAAVAADRS